ncbi:MAG TPA: methylated-DNA--[protein]-cysteine S-methyltransferase [Methylomirabilota bacterium]|nr:methylated-DNA--[protein]-cysteine S-methyltransferase [Methylomirabilota bacterium]
MTTKTMPAAKRLSAQLIPVSVPTSAGCFTAHFSSAGLAGLDFPAANTPCYDCPPHLRAWRTQTAAALERALKGQPPGAGPPLDLGRGTDFQRSVWHVLRTIPPGRTWSYGEVAAAAGRPAAWRATGNACGANPVPVLVPCHRVLASRGRLGGFSAGLHWKRRLLAAEGAWPREGVAELRPADGQARERAGKPGKL